MSRQTATQTQQQKPTPAPTAGGLLQRNCACGNHTIAGGECAECGKTKRFGLQTKLKINEPGDIYEREADRIADQVLAAPAHSTVSGAPPRIQRFAGQSTAKADAAPASVDQALASPGRPLDPTLRQDMEQRFGHDFSRVRVHSGAASEKSARDVNAHAYTAGHDIVFGAGRFAPGTLEGRRLIAHELTHVVQQSSAEGSRVDQSSGKRGLSPSSPSSYQVVNGSRAITSEPTPSGTRLQRACGPAEIGSQANCIGRGGDITNFGGDSGKIFQFRVGCDDLLSGEKARVQDLASTLSPDNQLEIDGFASEEGRADFNEDLSCARAKALASTLIDAGISTSQFDGLYMHGATPGARAERRSAVISIARTSSPRAPEDCGDLIGGCDFYLCRERRHPCGEGGYYKGYGYKYCERFTRLEPRLSAPGRDWVRKTLRCLQEHIDRNIPIDAPCSEVKQSAFDSHPDCYVLGGVCFLDPDEWLEILTVIDPKDNDLKQVLLTGVYCVANWGPVALFPQLSLGAGGGYRGLMERDRQRTRRLMQPPPRGR